MCERELDVSSLNKKALQQGKKIYAYESESVYTMVHI